MPQNTAKTNFSIQYQRLMKYKNSVYSRKNNRKTPQFDILDKNGELIYSNASVKEVQEVKEPNAWQKHIFPAISKGAQDTAFASYKVGSFILTKSLIVLGVFIYMVGRSLSWTSRQIVSALTDNPSSWGIDTDGRPDRQAADKRRTNGRPPSGSGGHNININIDSNNNY